MELWETLSLLLEGTGVLTRGTEREDCRSPPSSLDGHSTTGMERNNGESRGGFGDLGIVNDEFGNNNLSGEFFVEFVDKHDEDDKCDECSGISIDKCEGGNGERHIGIE